MAGGGLKAKTCKVCRAKFQPARPLQTTCSIPCAIEWGSRQLAKKQAKEAAEEKKQDRAKREKLKTRSDWMKDAQAAVNAWVRFRDRDQPCISCGTFNATAWHAGHFYSTAARPDLRLDPANIHRQCAQCNLFLSGNLIEYRKNLPSRIGQAELDRLDGPPTNQRMTAEVIKEICAEFKARLKQETKRPSPNSGAQLGAVSL